MSKNNINKFIAFLLGFTLLSSCSDFLDIVPDNTIIVEDYFANKEMAYNALSNVYAGLPQNHLVHYSEFLLGDDWLGQRDATRARSGLVGTRIMGGDQTATSPLQSFWEGRNYASHLYEVIRSANTFIEYIHLVDDMTNEEKDQWIAQVNFLKAYYHFILIQRYGPIVIVDKNLPPNATSEELFVARSKVDEGFDYVIALIKEAIPNLNNDTRDDQLGMVDQSVAKAILARIMLFRASPFFNGNIELFGDFFDHDGKHFFPMDAQDSGPWKLKWNDALAAVNDAITHCEQEGFGLYEYDDRPYKFDMDDWELNTETMQRHYTLRHLIVEPWNKELIWGRTYPRSQSSTLQDASNIRLPATFTNGAQEDARNSFNWGAASYQVMSRYYTENGLPIEADRTFDRNNMHRLVSTPEADSLEYEPLRGIMQPNFMTIKMYLEREPRFYANLGVTGGYWRGHQHRIDLEIYGGTPGGYDPGISQGDFLWSGIGVQKFVHPESKSGSYIRQKHFPYPIIRMADLYLMKAEILNEINGPSEEVYNEVNKIRRRAGIPDVETVWSDPELCIGAYLNRHQTKEGMRDIIMRERAIEFAFEGSRYWDVVRYKKAVSEFNTPVTGWIGNSYGPQNFFRLEIKQLRRFLNRNYLWPISISELNTNANLIQNPGWE